MPASFILSAGTFLHVAPYAVLCCYPFRHRLRLPPRILGPLLLLLAAAEFLIYLFVRNMPYFVEQAVFFLFLSAYFVVYLFAVRLNVCKLVFIFLVNTDYAAIVVGISNFLEIHLFPHCRHVGGYSVPLILLHLLLFAVTVPADAYIITKKIIPLLDLENIKAWRRLWLIPLMFLLTVVIFSGSDSDSLVSSWQYITVTATMAVAGYVVLYIIIEMLLRTDESAALREKTKTMETLLGFQKREYEKMSRQIAETRAARHDLRHHLSLVETYLQSENYGALREYLNEYRSSLPQSAGPPVSEHYAVNAILQHYAEIARAEHIRVRINIQIPRKTGFSDSDLCIVFGNCLENAIEACRAIPDGGRYINIKAKVHGDILGMAVDNSFDGAVQVKDGKFISKKRVNEEGIGLSSIKAIADKYNGKAIFSFDQCEFQTSIILNMKEKNEGVQKDAATDF
jgi:hypothetical protein